MHIPVMGPEVVERLGVRPGGTYVDGTVGGGGHARLILERSGPDGRLLGLDRDDEALAAAAETLAEFGPRCRLARGNFADMAAVAERHGIAAVDGILLDLGMSSLQVDQPDRGFSFMRDGPLDMRMDRRQALTAAQLVNTLEPAALAGLLRRYGEEPAAGRIARAVARARARRPLATTAELADVVARAVGGRRGARHPATRAFQALRLAVNGELQALESGFEAAVGLLAPGGRLAVLAYHSLEDGLVKRLARAHVGRAVSQPEGGVRWERTPPALGWVTRRPLTAGPEEQARNPRARSAKLRVMERMADDHGEAQPAPR